MSSLIRNEKLTAAAAFSFQDVERSARAALARAEQRAAEIIAAAREQAADAIEQERQRGFQAGLAEGQKTGLEQARSAAADAALAEARDALAKLSAALGVALTAFDGEKRALLANAEAGLIELAIAIARRVCKSVVAADPSAAIENVRRAADLLRHEHDLEIRVSPDEHAAIEQVVPELLGVAGAHAHVSLVADPTISRGGCTITARRGTIDATLETQLDRVAEALLPRNPLQPDPGEAS